MGKVKSAIITAILVAAIVVMAFFATVSFTVPGSNGVKRYNSFISSIHLGSELTGEAYVMLYPEGVISAADYNLVAEDEENDQKEEYEETYEARGGVYVEKGKLEDEQSFKDEIAADAVILSKRFGEKGYSSYSVSVEDGFAIKVSVPTNYTYASYQKYDTSSRSTALTEISYTVQYLTLDGKLTLRNGSDYDSSSPLRLNVNDDIATYFKSISYYAMGGTYAVKMELTDDGYTNLNTLLLTSDDTDSSAYFFVGETSLGLTITMGESISDKTLYYSADKSYAQDYSIILSSVVSGDILSCSYNTDEANISGTTIISTTPVFGEYAAIYLAVALLVILVASVAGMMIKYKKLGVVHMLVALMYTLAMICAIMLLEIQLTVAGAFTAVLGLALLTFTNIKVFESVRRESLLGRTIQSSVKLGYKRTVACVLDLHIVLIVVSAIVALIGIGDVAACGFIFFIASVASYVLYWFTRFMWYVLSSPARDKFKFCGFAREVTDDED